MGWLLFFILVRKLWVKIGAGIGLKLVSLAVLLLAVLMLPSWGVTNAAQTLVPLVKPGPWSGVSGLISYGGRLWFVNSLKFIDHNSADIYSYDPVSGKTRYERHLFSQDAGEPVVFGGLLFWPFEDSRFSARHGEVMITNGRDWQWRSLPDGEVFHIHTMVTHRGQLIAATSAWRAGLQRSEDGLAWRVMNDHPTPARTVTRITTLATLGDKLYAGLTDYRPEGSKLLIWVGDTLEPVAGWPVGTMVNSLTAYCGWLYGVNTTADGSALWRTDGKTVRRVTGLDGQFVSDLAADPDALWAVSADRNGGTLWRSTDGLTWKAEQRFNDANPIDVYVTSEGVYVGTHVPGGRGTLWGPPPPSATESKMDVLLIMPEASSIEVKRLRSVLDSLDRLLSDGPNYRANRRRLLATLQPLALSRLGKIGAALAARLDRPYPDSNVKMYGGQMTVPVARMGRWYLLRAIALNGHGKISPDLLLEPWKGRPNRPGKYLYLPSAAAWTAAELGQADDETIGALIAGLGSSDRPLWSVGDFVGALSALTDQRFGYDLAAWQAWWERRKTKVGGGMIHIPEGTLLMGSDDGEPAEQPVHRVDLPPFSIDRFETTNAEFAAFVVATGHITSAEATGVGWDWDGEWREVKGADWRHPHGLASSLQGLERHPVVQVSWIDAQAYCRWRGKRLPTEAEWERAARGDSGRIYPWSNQPPHVGKRYRASYGSDRCCRAEAGDEYMFTAPVGSFPLGRSPFGLEDMAGNVWEWVEDWFDREFYRQSLSENPVNDTPGKRRVIRGGGWGNNPSGLRSTLRHANPPDIGLSMVGFRCAG